MRSFPGFPALGSGRGGVRQAPSPPPGWSHDPQTLKFWTQQLSFGAAWQKVVYKAFSTGFMWFLRHLSKPCVLRLGGEDPTGKFCLFFGLNEVLGPNKWHVVFGQCLAPFEKSIALGVHEAGGVGPPRPKGGGSFRPPPPFLSSHAPPPWVVHQNKKSDLMPKTTLQACAHFLRHVPMCLVRYGT